MTVDNSIELWWKALLTGDGLEAPMRQVRHTPSSIAHPDSRPLLPRMAHKPGTPGRCLSSYRRGYTAPLESSNPPRFLNIGLWGLGPNIRSRHPIHTAIF